MAAAAQSDMAHASGDALQAELAEQIPEQVYGKSRHQSSPEIISGRSDIIFEESAENSFTATAVNGKCKVHDQDF
jgi:hypothetical protein